MADITVCPGRRGQLSALSVFLCKSVFYGVFVWARRALNSQKWRFPARAVAGVAARLRLPDPHGLRAGSPLPRSTGHRGLARADAPLNTADSREHC